MALLQELRQSCDTDWEPGPGQHEIAHYDSVKAKYRRHVEDYLGNCRGLKDLQKKKFVNISTNVLCAVIDSDKDHIPNYIRDLYMPVELSVTKWSLDMKEEQYVTHHFMFYPGEPARNGRVEALNHKPNHKIEGIQDGPFETPRDQYKDVLSKIYQMISHDYTLFSLSLLHVRQDMGCIKWLIDQVCGVDGSRKKYKPLRMYSLHDLYIIIARRVGFFSSIIGTKVAEKQLGGNQGYEYELGLLCDYHKQAQYETGNCTRANCIAKARKFTQDIKLFQSIVGALDRDESEPAKEGTRALPGPSAGQEPHASGDVINDLENSFKGLTTSSTKPTKPTTSSRN